MEKEKDEVEDRKEGDRENDEEDGTHIAIFNGKRIRKRMVNGEWFFSIVDIVGVLTESSRPRKYWSDLKSKLIDEGSELSAKIGQLKFKSKDGKESIQKVCKRKS